MSTRKMVLASWNAARRKADVDGAVKLNAASFAGFALLAAEGDVDAARRLVPMELEVFWARVRADLDQVALEESPMRSAAGGIR